MELNSKKSQHILSASSNLVGFSFIVLTTVKALHASGVTILDEVASVEILFFSSSCLLSFLSIRAGSEKKARLYENIADITFFLGLALIFVTAVILLFGEVD